MYDPTDLTKVGKHDYNKKSAIDNALRFPDDNFSINVFKWGLTADGKRLKQLKGLVRIHGNSSKIKQMIDMADMAVKDLDNNEWDGRKNVFI